MKTSKRFKHESLQDQQSIADLLKALTNGIGKGKVVLEDDNGTMTLEPSGLLRLKISGTQEEERNRIDLRITWDEKRNIPKKKTIKVNGK